jgi:hypothetical protein
MSLALGLTVAAALLQISSDVLLGLWDPRVRVGLLRKRGAAE